MSEAVKKSTKRIYKWDNLKCFLIVMVVIGHFCKSICPDIEYNEESFSFYIFFPYAAFYFFVRIITKKMVTAM